MDEVPSNRLINPKVLSGDPGPPRITPEDARYEDLALRVRNERFEHRPRYFRVPRTTEQVVTAVTEAVRAGDRITIRSGGHSMENSVGEASDGVIIDLSAMNGVYHDPGRRAFVVESGATLGEIYRVLYLTWGVTIPGGWGHSVCVGGHIQGGGYGVLSRSLGSVVDYLFAVEVVVVDADGTARAVIATRDPADPHHELWWAHTGGGGGNFGVVTRYWLRSAVTPGDDPAQLLPPPPATLLTGVRRWTWDGLTRDAFHQLMDNHGRWHQANSSPGCRYAALASRLVVTGRGDQEDGEAVVVAAMIDGGLPDARRMLADYLDEVGDGVGGEQHIGQATPWLYTMMPPVPDGDAHRGAEYDRYKGKAGYLRRGFTRQQIDTVYDYLTSPRAGVELARLWLLAYGGQINAVDPAATALAQRDSVLKAVYIAIWSDAADDAENLDWMRRFYRDVYAETGGVPVPGEVHDGTYINYPDTDLADPAWNTSGVPWHYLYYKDNYERLRRVKRDWDPRDVFRHALSVRPADPPGEPAPTP
ncbi:FAD-binding oxidoreductase [Actinoalloteichus caeruleus]|uniref:FAD-binding oxidoreductase n=1 Tax=Actinoalloteichus cyanogriseus TaxID=2893586 RepID=UPI0009DE259B|nr:FAD-binding protein [Actinoalloteichus caeruleus]